MNSPKVPNIDSVLWVTVLHPPYILVNILLLFIRTISPYFTCINRVDTTLYLILIWVLYSLGQTFSKSWNRLHCSLQAFGYYCQWLPGLTTKSTHYYLHSHYFRTRFTFIALRILPLTLSFDIVPLDPLAPKLMTRLSASAQIPMTQRLARIDYIIECRIQAVTSTKYYFGSLHTLNIK